MRNQCSINLTFVKDTLCPVKRYISRLIGYRTVGHVQFEMLTKITGRLFPEVDMWTFRTKKHRDQIQRIKLIVPGETGLYPGYIDVPAKYVKLPGERVFTRGRERPDMLMEKLNKAVATSDDIRLTEWNRLELVPVQYGRAVVLEPKRGM